MYNLSKFCFGFLASVSDNFETRIMLTCMSTSRLDWHVDLKKHADHGPKQNCWNLCLFFFFLVLSRFWPQSTYKSKICGSFCQKRVYGPMTLLVQPLVCAWLLCMYTFFSHFISFHFIQNLVFDTCVNSAFRRWVSILKNTRPPTWTTHHKSTNISNNLQKFKSWHCQCYQCIRFRFTSYSTTLIWPAFYTSVFLMGIGHNNILKRTTCAQTLLVLCLHRATQKYCHES